MQSWFTTTGRDDSQSGVPGTPLLGDMLETHFVEFHLRLLNPKPGMGPGSLCLSNNFS